ncbi:hypothetical protein Cflav_PD0854 [Pedosphaera parvula Ellin514]|uniref:Uncharacterized protein n=1 Tax=Pedosphaera parvula (strain Ellin514) TaxID=320771 RepID=B9XQH9_PEDPL|nr:hypothetical protein Cflav_PD0854 [Pedosphaera parvula Ellin514]
MCMVFSVDAFSTFTIHSRCMFKGLLATEIGQVLLQELPISIFEPTKNSLAVISGLLKGRFQPIRVHEFGRYRKVSEGIGRYRKVSEGIGRYRKVSEGIGRYRKVKKIFCMPNCQRNENESSSLSGWHLFRCALDDACDRCWESAHHRLEGTDDGEVALSRLNSH